MEIERIKKAMEKYELPMVNIYFSKRLFEVTFKRPDLQINSYKRRVIDGKGFEYSKNVPENVPEIQRLIIVEMKKNNKITYNELAKTIGKNRKTILRHISVLKEKRIIKRIGPAKGGHWEVIEK